MVMRSHAEPPAALPLHPGGPPPPPSHANGLLYNMEQHVAGLRAAAGSAPPYGQLVSPTEPGDRSGAGAISESGVVGRSGDTAASSLTNSFMREFLYF